MKWLAPGEVTRYLGYPFGHNIPQKEKDGKMLSQIRKHLSKWTHLPLSLAGRIMIANQVVLSSIWYFASCTDYTGKALRIAKATVRNYIWSGKKESNARAKVRWDTVVLPIVRGGIKVLDPQWQSSALLIKLLIRGLSVGYEPWKALVRFRVAQTKQARRGSWPPHSNWIMNARHLVNQGSSMWQGVLKAWSTMQPGLEQQDPTSWDEITRQPLFGNRFLTDERGIQWGTGPQTKMKSWAERRIWSIKDIIQEDGNGWKPFPELVSLRRCSSAPQLYDKVIQSIPWQPVPILPSIKGLWIAAKEDDGNINRVYHTSRTEPLTTTVYVKSKSEQLHMLANSQPLPPGQYSEVRVAMCGGSKRRIMEFNPKEIEEPELTVWMWGNDWICNLEWDPKEWTWRRIGVLADTSVLNYCTKRGYRVALQQNNHKMKVDIELEEAGYQSKVRAKFFNRIWHPYLPRKVSAMQWLILTEGLPVGAWRERLGLPNHCQLCIDQPKETLQHAFQECPEVKRAWDLFRATRNTAGLPPNYNSWKEISRGLMTDTPGPAMEEALRWDTAAAFTVNMDTPWDILRAQLLWAIWCQRVAVAFREEVFHLGVVLWQAWKNTIYCAIEAYKELFRHARNEEKRQELISCFQKVWTQAEIFGRLRGGDIKWNLTPHKNFLPEELGAWNANPIRIQRMSPSPDLEAEFTARNDFSDLVDAFIQGISDQQETRAQAYPYGLQGDSTPRAEPASTRGEAETDTPPSTNQEAQDTGAPDSPLQLPGDNLRKRKTQVYQGKENVEPQPPTHGEAGTSRSSRPKRKCFRKNKKTPKPLNPNLPQLANNEPGGRPREGPRSRPKLKCNFGPRRPGNQHNLEEREAPEKHKRLRLLSPSSDRITSTAPPHTARASIINSTTTLAPPPFRVRRTPFDRYKPHSRTWPEQDPGPDPYRFVYQKLGITATEFEDRVNTEIEELFQEIENERRQALLETLPFERPLSKDDCLRLFSSSATPQTGSTIGILRWASEREEHEPPATTSQTAP
jgi:hypothetical protein